MNKLFAIPLVAVILLSGCTTSTTTTTTTPAATTTTSMTMSVTSQVSSATSSTSIVVPIIVTIHNYAFSNQTITIHVGDTVTWTNMDSVSHTVTSDSGSELNSGNIATGQSYSHTFTQAGTYTYHCAIHPQMTATVVVTQ